MSIQAAERNGPSPSRLGRHLRAAAELREMLIVLGLSRTRLASLLARAPRTVRHWAFGTRIVPREVAILLRLACMHKITVDDIANRGFEPVAADQDSAQEIGLEIDQLNGKTCRWPLQESKTSMRFCGEVTVTDSVYCSAHAAAARRSPGRPRST